MVGRRGETDLEGLERAVDEVEEVREQMPLELKSEKPTMLLMLIAKEYLDSAMSNGQH